METRKIKTVHAFIRIGMVIALYFITCHAPVKGQHSRDTINYDEEKIPPYVLPHLLTADNGGTIKTVKEWESIQRPAILRKFTENVYGTVPGRPRGIHYKTTLTDERALNGQATRKEITIYFTEGEKGPSLVLLLYLPNNTRGKVPVFVGLNFNGIHTVQADTTISITDNWKRINTNNAPSLKKEWPQKPFGWTPTVKNLVPQRGEAERRWPVAEIIAAGYGVGTAYYEDLEPDHPDGWKTGIRTTMAKELTITPDAWGSISAWAWGLSRMMDYLETDAKVNAQQVIVTGHSRLGKTALWAAANDQRFAMVVSNNSGEGGASLSKRMFGETIELINRVNPHWCIEKYKTYNFAAYKLPVDQHMLLALAAPRPLYVASAVEDEPADPKGEFLSAKFATPVYDLYGKRGLGVDEQPPVDTPVGDTIGYHVRSGDHDMILYDWQQFIRFANRHFKRK